MSQKPSSPHQIDWLVWLNTPWHPSEAATSGEYVDGSLPSSQSAFHPSSKHNKSDTRFATVTAANCFVVSLSQTLTTPKNFNDWKRGASTNHRVLHVAPALSSLDSHRIILVYVPAYTRHFFHCDKILTIFIAWNNFQISIL